MLPNGWAVETLGIACSLLTDGTHHSPSNSSSGDFPYITAKNIKWHGFELDDMTYVSKDEHEDIYRRCPVETGDVLLIKDGATTGVATINTLDEPFSMLSSVALLRPIADLLNNRFLWHWLRSGEAQGSLLGAMSGSAIRRLTLTTIGRTSLPIAPIVEQRRIVERLDALTVRVARARAELDRVPVLAEHLRRSSLNAAFRGDLSADHRQDELGQLRQTQPKLDDQERGIWLTKSVPASWRWVEIEDFFEDLTDSKRKLPEKEYDRSGPYPVIDQGKRQIGGYTHRQDLLHPATARVVVFGDHTRCVKLVEPPFVQGADGVKVLAAAEGVDVQYARFALLAVEIPAKGYSRHMKFVRKTVWPLPSLTEQAIIVERLDGAFARANRLEAEAARARTLLDRLEAAILAKAFRGELVPQDPSDEPASVLLDRIRARRAEAPKHKRGRRAAVGSAA